MLREKPVIPSPLPPASAPSPLGACLHSLILFHSQVALKTMAGVTFCGDPCLRGCYLILLRFLWAATAPTLILNRKFWAVRPSGPFEPVMVLRVKRIWGFPQPVPCRAHLWASPHWINNDQLPLPFPDILEATVDPFNAPVGGDAVLLHNDWESDSSRSLGISDRTGRPDSSSSLHGHSGSVT